MNGLFLRTLSLAASLTYAITAGAAAGRLPGSPSVSPTGTAGYSIPINVPPGTHGITPQLAIAYGHRSQSSLLGIGWGIAGLSSITRCRSTWAQDGNGRDVRNDLTDRFCLDGNKLRLVTGTYGVAGSTYRTEIESFSRITASGAAGNGPASFTVEQKNGLIYEYGTTANSLIESVGQSTARAWAVSKIRDRTGNAITFTYTEDATNGSYRISSIQYTSNAGQGLSAAYLVSFVYETKPSNEIDSGYIAGSVVKEVTRLDRIDITYNSAQVRRYELTYEGALSSTSLSRLASVQECGGATLDCMPATTFTYQNGTPGIASEVSSGNAVPSGQIVWPLDVNGDGREDLVWASSITPGAGTWRVMFANSSGGYNAAINTGVTSAGSGSETPIDYNADGLEDLLVPISGVWNVMLGTTSGLASPVSTGAPATTTGTGGNARAIDVDGDGLEDLVWADLVGYAGGDAIRYRLRVWGGGFSSTVSTLVSPMAANNTIVSNPFYPITRRSRKYQPDFNGDGRPDIVYRTTFRERDQPSDPWIYSYQIRTKVMGGFSSSTLVGTGANVQLFGDFNGDGKSDLMFKDTSTAWKVRFSTGTALGTAITSTAINLQTTILDWDGDGYDDVLTATLGSNWYVIRSSGEAFLTAVNTGILCATGTTEPTITDVNGDGLDDLAYNASGTWKHRPHAGSYPDLMLTATDGHGNATTFAYAPLTSASYTKYSDATYPEQDVQDSTYVIDNVTDANGVGGTYTVTYQYHGARVNLQGRGFEGFYALRTIDSRDGLYHWSYFNRLFPLTGTSWRFETYQSNGSTLIARTNNTWTAHSYGTGFETRSLPYVSSSTTTRYEVGGAYNAALLTTSVTTNSVDSATGTLYDSSTTVTEDSAANGVQSGQSYTSRTYLSSLYTDTTNWCIGRPATTQQINSHTNYGGTTLTRQADTTWDGLYCRPTQVVEQPGDPLWQVTTGIGYDGFGNVNSETVTGVGMAARTTSASWGSTGQFPVSVTNALSQATQNGWNYSLGVPTSQTDPNGIAVSWQYDVFGRRTREDRPDTTATTWSYDNCTTLGCVHSNNKLTVTATQLNASAGAIRYDYTYLDRFDRAIVSRGLTLSGAYNRVDREYDALGRVYRDSAPCWWSSCTNYWTTYTYDAINRVTQVSRPISDSNPSLQTTSMYFEGMTTRSVDPLARQTTQVATAAGLAARSTDHAGYYQSFDYDAFGNALRITDSASNTLLTATFNIRGMLLSTSDPDRGSRTLVPNALGELVTQTDALSKTQTFTYDALGRVTSRVMPECSTFGGTITSSFVWGTSAAAKNIGKLDYHEQSGCSQTTFRETFSYDSLGRLAQTDSLEGGSTHYYVNRGYSSSTGYLETLEYPTSTQSYRLKVQYDYQYGLMLRAKDFAAPTTVFWQANATDARGAVIDESLGASVQTIRGYDQVTGRIDFIQSGPGGSGTLQNLNYQWDTAGNLTERQDVNQSLTEHFYYDDLHRLDYSTRNGVTNLDLAYNQYGNITSKTGVGTYTYHATRIHAVSSINTGSGTLSYSYDANGQMTSRSGTMLVYYADGLIKQANNDGLHSSTFSYTADGRRWANFYAAGDVYYTRYIGDAAGVLYERITPGGGTTEHKHYIRAGGDAIALYVRKEQTGPIYTNTLYYLLKDSLGSTDVITDAAGAVVVRESFDAYGKRRGTTWSGNPTAGELNTMRDTTRRGFTFHEHLDSVDLVHMNGRAYDPFIGRFVSGDPIVQAPGNTQSYNRYSYVFNNPLSLTDPSGFTASNDDKPRRCNSGDCQNSVTFRYLGPSVSCYGSCGGGYWNSPQISAVRTGSSTSTTGSRSATGAGLEEGDSTSSLYDVYAGRPSEATYLGEFDPAIRQFESANNPSFDSSFDAGFFDGLGGFRSTAPRNFGAAVRAGAAGTIREMQFAAVTTAAFEVVVVPAAAVVLGAIRGLVGAARGAVATAESAQNVVNGVRLSGQLARESANSAFTASGELSQGAISGARQIFAPGTLGNPAIPNAFGKYATETFASPSGPFQAHFYMNPTTGEVMYGLDYKVIFNLGF